MKVVNCDRTIYVRTLNIAIVCASHSFVCWFFFFFIFFFFYFAIFPSLYFGGRNVSFLPRCALTDASYTDVQRNDKRKRKEAISLGLYKNRLNHNRQLSRFFIRLIFSFFLPFFRIFTLSRLRFCGLYTYIRSVCSPHFMQKSMPPP